jgi:hypothetical protein
MTEMMIEAREARTSAQEMKKAIVSCGMGDALLAGARSSRGDAAIGQAYGATIGKFKMIFEETTIKSKAGNFRGIVLTI